MPKPAFLSAVLLIILSSLAVGAAEANNLPGPGGPGSEVIVQFTNGDRLHGRILSIDGKKEVRLANSGIKETMEFVASDIARLEWVSHEPAPSNSGPKYAVRFVNQDEMLGQVTLLDAENLVLETPSAGSLRFPRRNVQSIRLLRTAPLIYEGPTALEGWTVSGTKEGQGGDAWKYRDGTFYAKEAGAIARDVKLPDMASLDFDAVWRDFLQLTVTLYTDSLNVYQLSRNVQGAGGIIMNVPAPPQEGAGFYAVQLNRNTAYLLTVKKDGQVINSPLDMLAGLELKNKAHISLRINKVQKSITLLVDGLFVKTWTDTEAFAGQGTAVRFVQQGQATLSLSNIKIGTWDGNFEVPSAPTANLTKDFLQLRNEDNLSGKLEGMREGVVSFTTSFGTLEVPVDRVAQIEFPVDPKATIPADPQSVRAFFPGRGSLTFRIEEWSNQQLVASSPNFGKATFNVDAFERIEFKPEPARTP